MADNPFAPPKAHVEDSDETRKPSSIWKGVLIGGAIDLVGTVVLMTIVSVLYVVLNISPDMTPDQIEGLNEQLRQELASFGTIWGFAGLVVGGGSSLLGGYICAIFAKERWKMAALILGIAFSLLGLFMGTDTYTLGENLSLNLLTFVMIYLGGWLREGRRTSKP